MLSLMTVNLLMKIAGGERRCRLEAGPLDKEGIEYAGL